MYTELPTTEEEFEDMVNDILDGYDPYPVCDEIILRMRIDLNYLLKESEVMILDDDDSSLMVDAYQVRENPHGDGIEICPVWQPVEK